MSAAVSSAGPAERAAARLVLARLGVSARDLLQTTPSQASAPTFAEYVPIVAAAVSAGTRRVYASYWNRILEHWGQRRLDEPIPSEIKHLAEHIRTMCSCGATPAGDAVWPSTSSLPYAACTTTPSPTA